MNINREIVPADFPVRPLEPGQQPIGAMTCGHCGRSWDDLICTSMTPVPSGRCPFEAFHVYPSPADTTLECPECGQLFVQPVASGLCINCDVGLVPGPDLCPQTGQRHVPVWSTVSATSDGGQTHIDVLCGQCGQSGCVGVVDWKEKEIDWQRRKIAP